MTLGLSFLVLGYLALVVAANFGDLLRWLIPRRLGGYRQVVSPVDPTQPLRLQGEKKVAVLGGGLAGIAAAATLGERGYQVTLYEKRAQLGGKLTSFPVRVGDEEVWISHGFHAFFRHYYNLNHFLDRLGLRRSFRAIDDYVILTPHGEALAFGALEPTPVLNLLAMAQKGFFRWDQILFGPAKDHLGIFLEYDPERTFKELDHLSFADFAQVAALPPRLKLAFNTFSRAFFADEDKMSLAELVKCFHFYYLGHDGGLLYDFPTKDFEAALWTPIRRHLQGHGVELRLGRAVGKLGKTNEGFIVDGERFDQVVLATDVVGARAILESAPGLSGLSDDFRQLRPGQRYAVWRLWIDRDVRAGLPVFVITDRQVMLDAVALYHHLEDESRAWVAQHGGAVIELHSYAVPDRIADEATIRHQLLAELVTFFPELKQAHILHQHLEVRRDFTAFHVGHHQRRPTSRSGVPGLHFAGDWVKLPFPAMLMEAAFASGVVAANQVLESDGLRSEVLYTVPRRGLLAGLPRNERARRTLSESGRRPA